MPKFEMECVYERSFKDDDAKTVVVIRGVTPHEETYYLDLMSLPVDLAWLEAHKEKRLKFSWTVEVLPD